MLVYKEANRQSKKYLFIDDVGSSSKRRQLCINSASYLGAQKFLIGEFILFAWMAKYANDLF